MRRFAALLLTVTMLLGVVSTCTAQSQPAKLLIGKWEGDIQQTRGRTSSDRTLVIESIGEGEGPLPVKGRWGITGQGLGRMEGTLETTGGQTVLRFTTGAGSTVVLQLQGEKDLVGTFNARGSGQRLQESPLRLKKVE